MANIVAYDEVAVGAEVVTPNWDVTRHAARCALFYLDPKASGPVRWRADGTPTSDYGIPIYPGDSVVMAGAGNIRNSKFVSGDGANHRLYIVYYDAVDVVLMSFQQGRVATAVMGTPVTLNDVLYELQRIRSGISLLTDDSLKEIL